MKFALLFAAAVTVAKAGAKACQDPIPEPDADGRYTISAPGIKAQVGSYTELPFEVRMWTSKS